MTLLEVAIPGSAAGLTTAKHLIGQLPHASDLVPTKLPSTLYHYFTDGDRLVVVAGEAATTKHAGWALVYGLSELSKRPEHQLVLVLPAAHAFSTAQRVPWLKPEAQPEVWVHEHGYLEPVHILSRDQTVENVLIWAEMFTKSAKAPGPETELTKASTPYHLGEHSECVAALVEWATSHPQLDASHLQTARVWHCAGQRVLSIQHQAGAITIRAGIHDSAQMANPDVILTPGQVLSEDQLVELQKQAAGGIAERLGGLYLKPDEHWLQSVIRRNPSLVGVESPALREVPAWRPSGAPGTFGRGFLDLLGLDGHGDIRLVEAKLAKSNDDMTLMQGLDYHVWAQAYQHAIRQKLSAPKKARIRLHYAVGVKPGDPQLLPTRVYQYAHALDTEAVPFRVHVMAGWDTLKPDPRTKLATRPWSESELPTLAEHNATDWTRPTHWR